LAQLQDGARAWPKAERMGRSVELAMIVVMAKESQSAAARQ